MKEIRVFERKCLRQCNGLLRTPENYKYVSNDELYARSKVVPIDKHMFVLCEKFIDNLVTLDNSLIAKIVEDQNDVSYYDRCLLPKRYLPVSGLKYYVEKGLIWDSDRVLKFYE